MQIETHPVEPITESQTISLKRYRDHRKFDPKKYVEIKTKILLKYMKKAGLKAAIVALSGGVDSAVVAAMVSKLKDEIRVVGVSLPDIGNPGVVDQNEGKCLSKNLSEKLGIEFHCMDVRKSAREIEYNVWNAFDIQKTSFWASGQLSPYVRTPYLYFISTILKDTGFPSIIVGTTNRDEGAYLGYVGKASDGMVDVQLISDLHKSEVYAVAKYLGVTEEIIKAVPKGDMFDARCDEEIFGATYDFVELFIVNQHLKGKAADNLRNLHKYNSHKYLVGSPAVHLDIYESGVHNGWSIQFETKYFNQISKFYDSQIHTYLSLRWTMYRESIDLIYEKDGCFFRKVGLFLDKIPFKYLDGDYTFDELSHEHNVGKIYVVSEKIKHS